MLTILVTGFVLGVVGSLHCVGMCGPLVAACVSGQAHHPGRATFSYQIGRISTYGLLGLLFGFFGASIQIFSSQAQASLIFGVLLIAVGLFGRRLEKHAVFTATLGRGFAWIGKRFGAFAPLGFGALNGLLPCALVYTALAASLTTGDALYGALFMIAFGVGTSPLLVAVGAVSGRWRSLTTRLFPVFTVVAGALLIYRSTVAELPYDWMNYLALNPQLNCH